MLNAGKTWQERWFMILVTYAGSKRPSTGEIRLRAFFCCQKASATIGRNPDDFVNRSPEQLTWIDTESSGKCQQASRGDVLLTALDLSYDGLSRVSQVGQLLLCQVF